MTTWSQLIGLMSGMAYTPQVSASKTPLEDTYDAISRSLSVIDAMCPGGLHSTDYCFDDWLLPDAIGFVVNHERRCGNVVTSISLPADVFTKYRETFLGSEHEGYWYTIQYDAGNIKCLLWSSVMSDGAGVVNLKKGSGHKFEFKEPDPDNIIKYTYYHSGIDVPYEVITAVSSCIPQQSATQLFPDSVQIRTDIGLKDALWGTIDKLTDVYEVVEIGLLEENYKQAESFCNFTRYGLKLVDEECSVAIVEMNNPHIVLRDKATGQMSGNIPLRD